MDEREQQRKVRHRLAVLRHAEEVTGSVAATCRYYGITRQCFYKWRRRYEDLGEEGLRDGSSAPLHRPNETTAEVVGKIIYLRQHYHFGPLKISMYLKRYDDIEIGHSGGYRILKRCGLNRLPASQRSNRYPAPARSTTNTPRSTIAPGSGCCASTPTTTRRPRSSSSTTCSRSSRSGSRSSKPTTVPSSKVRSTGTSSTGGSATSTSSRPHHV